MQIVPVKSRVLACSNRHVPCLVPAHVTRVLCLIRSSHCAKMGKASRSHHTPSKRGLVCKSTTFQNAIAAFERGFGF